MVRLERSTGLARKIAATSKTSRRTADVAATLMSISSLSEKGRCVISFTYRHNNDMTKLLEKYWELDLRVVHKKRKGTRIQVLPQIIPIRAHELMSDKKGGAKNWTSRTSMSLTIWLSSLLMESSVPGTTVKIREVPGVSDGPTAKLCKYENR